MPTPRFLGVGIFFVDVKLKLPPLRAGFYLAQYFES